MKKRVFYAAALAAILASCSSDNLSLPQVAQDSEAPGIEGAVNFSAYTQRDITRAGYKGEMNDTQLQQSKEQGGGFGVFGYYTDQQDYDLQISKPNFMYNQGVFYTGSKWDYTPIKYWPNEYGSDAESQDIDKVTFYAYAPYVEVNPTTGKVTGDDATGITAVSRNTNTGDPIVWYKGSFKPSEAVDLCWGVVGSEADADWTIIQDKAIQKMEVGFPWINVQRPEGTSDQKMKFTFKHALAQLNIQIDADPDLTAHDESTAIATDTKVYVRSITFSGLASKGSLNLNNIVANEPLWQSYYGSGSIYSETATIFDGRRDGKEGVAGATAVNETLTGLNPVIISDDNNTQAGVTKQLVNLFAADNLTDAIYTIPTGEPISVTITYDVETADPNLAGVLSDGVTKGSSIENKITKEVIFGEDEYLKAGKKYTLILHLGLNSVKFDATVSPWVDNSANGETWLPSNVAKGVAITKGDGISLTKALVPSTGLTLTADVQPSDVVNKDITWSLSGENAANATLSTTSGSTTKISRVGNFVGPVTLNAYNPGTGKTSTITVYCTEPSSTANAEDNGRVVGSDGNLYLKKADVAAYSETADAKGIAMVADGANHLAIALSDYGRATWDAAQALDNNAFKAKLGELANKEWKLPTAAQLQAIFKAVGKNNYTSTFTCPAEGGYVSGADYSSEVTRKFFPWGNLGTDESQMVDKTSKFLDKGGTFNDQLNTEGMSWSTLDASQHNILVSYGLFRKALVDCGGTNVASLSYWLQGEEYSASQAWGYYFTCSNFWHGNKTVNFYVRPVLGL